LVTNAFSINMLTQGDISLNFSRLPDAETSRLHCLMALRNEVLVNAIGHKDLDAIVRRELNLDSATLPPGQRMTVSFPMDRDTDQQMLVAQYRGPRLPEGTTELPDDAEIEWWIVTSFAGD